MIKNGDWIRTCQECNHIQLDKKPIPGYEPSIVYMNRKCKFCKSMALDYGKELKENNEDEE